MGKIYGLCDYRRGKIGDLVFRKVADKNIVSEKANYYPVNSAWLKKEEFKKYVLSLLNEGIPQIYIFNELPEETYPYALIFVQNQGGTSVYIDKDGVRTHINLGDNGYDGVDVTDNIPENPRDNTIYFVNQPGNKNNNKNIAECDLYVCENNELKQIVLKSEGSADLDYVKKVCDYITTKSLSTAYDSNLIANQNVITSPTGKLTTEEKPHAFVHHIHCRNLGQGDVNFYVYSYSSTELTMLQLGYYLEGLGCMDAYHLYPATGHGYNKGSIVIGVYITKSGTTTPTYNLCVSEFYNSRYTNRYITDYDDRQEYFIYPIF